MTNIIVKDDKIEAIIDWEYSGYYPWWAERWLSFMGGDDQSNELFNLLWADIDSEMSKDTFHNEIAANIGPVLTAWDKCYFYVEHPNYDIKWLRPGFCKCKPFVGYFDWIDLGNQPEHKLKDISVVKSLIHKQIIRLVKYFISTFNTITIFPKSDVRTKSAAKSLNTR